MLIWENIQLKNKFEMKILAHRKYISAVSILSGLDYPEALLVWDNEILKHPEISLMYPI